MGYLGRKASQALDKANPKNPLVALAKGARAIDRAVSTPPPPLTPKQKAAQRIVDAAANVCQMRPSSRSNEKCEKPLARNQMTCGSRKCAEAYRHFLAAEEGAIEAHPHATVMRKRW